MLLEGRSGCADDEPRRHRGPGHRQFPRQDLHDLPDERGCHLESASRGSSVAACACLALVDQQKIRRPRTGLIAHDPARAQAGYTLFAPMLGDGTVFLVDMDGKVAHTWRPPFRPGLYGYLLDNGHLFYGGKVMDELGRFEAWPRFKGRAG